MRKLGTLLFKPSLLLPVLALSGCVTIQNAPTCTAAGLLSKGAICSRLTTADTNLLTFHETIDLIEAQPERVCIPVPGYNVCAENPPPGSMAVKLPARGAAIIMPASNWDTLKTELSQLCRMLGNKCQIAGITLQ